MNNPIHKTHVGVYGIAKHNNKIALILKSRGPYTGMLDLPGGKIEYGETVEECLKREIKEELNANITDFKLLTVLQNSITYSEKSELIQLQHIGIIFEINLENNFIESVSEHDVAESKWHEVSHLNKDNLTFLAKHGII